MKSSFSVLAAICGLMLLPHSAFSETKAQAKKREQAEQQRLQRKVTKVLQGERMGVIPDRQKALKTLIDSGHAPDEAYWQAGYIKKGDQWVSVEQRWLDRAEEAKLDEYAEVRNPTWNTPEANFELAKWCDQNGLHEQARAHLMSILLDHPDNAQLRQMLGYQKIGNRWMNEEEFKAAVDAAERLAKNLQKWGPVVAEIRAGLDSGDTRKQNAAKVKLEQIDDLDAIPAMELILLPGSKQAASACIKQFTNLKNREATLALCRAAMFLPETSIEAREAAIREIRERPYEDFVPALLAETSDPMSYRTRLFITNTAGGNQNRAVLQVIGQSEGYHTNNIFVDTHVFQFRVRTVLPLDSLPPWARRGELFLSNHEDNQLAFFNSLRTSVKKIESTVEYQTNLNYEISDLLSNVTLQTEPNAPKDWWNWWNRLNFISLDRKTIRVHEDVVIEEVNELEFMEVHSCFIAETPVWTDRGPSPIEKLHIGDMVLTKDVESGELTYKPIIRTTVREPKPLVTIDLGPEQITATLGHPFWVSGAGWVKARDLKPRQWIHTPTGSVEVENVTEAEEREVYNLVVDGFHTYFVGQSQLLCHDVSITSPTDAIVPGLIER